MSMLQGERHLAISAARVSVLVLGFRGVGAGVVRNVLFSCERVCIPSVVQIYFSQLHLTSALICLDFSVVFLLSFFTAFSLSSPTAYWLPHSSTRGGHRGIGQRSCIFVAPITIKCAALSKGRTGADGNGFGV